MKTGLLFIVALALAALTATLVLRTAPPSPPAAGKPPERLLVLTGHVSTFSLASSLAEGTAIEVAWAWPRDIVWEDQPEATPTPPAREAAAVVTLRAAAPSDPLLAAVRQVNFRVVEIDATTGPDLRTPVVKLTGATDTTSPGPAFPLVPSNGMRMAEVLARELARLDPPHRTRITENLGAVKDRLFRLQLRTGQQLARAIDVEVRLQTPIFHSLAEDLGLMVRPADDSNVRVILSVGSANQDRSRPALDVLTGAPETPEHYFKALETNLAKIADALSSDAPVSGTAEE